ncbi:acyl-CoA carboxylase subunit epsilon [Streptomyces brevispora]|uniref:acyl-CoA carboxylase subunit epsilon n=1 Tax=Streptomyces brevispora TaxID=887462 RepID=UPI0033C907A8
MGDTGTAPTFRVERGRATDAELAAVTAVLCSLLAGRDEENSDVRPPPAPRWEPERAGMVYHSPYSWR